MKQQSSQQATQAFAELTPEHILDAVEASGVACDGRLLALNSYENRVYQVGIENAAPLIAKFYRPQRWSDEAIIEEHDYTRELAEQELPVIAPLADVTGCTLRKQGAYRFALYPRRGGHAPELDNSEHLRQLGRLLGRIHALGRTHSFSHRPVLDIETMAVQPRQFLLDSGFIPEHLVAAYSTITRDLIEQIRHCYERAGTIQTIRLHGDCHPGNVLWTDDGPLLVDFDDARTGPALQDGWMFLSGDRNYMSERLADLLDGYTRFCEFNPRELHLVEALRTMRMIYYTAWIAQRWSDPAFPVAFPFFDTNRYWEDYILSLREQAALLDEAPLIWD